MKICRTPYLREQKGACVSKQPSAALPTTFPVNFAQGSGAGSACMDRKNRHYLGENKKTTPFGEGLTARCHSAGRSQPQVPLSQQYQCLRGAAAALAKHTSGSAFSQIVSTSAKTVVVRRVGKQTPPLSECLSCAWRHPECR